MSFSLLELSVFWTTYFKWYNFYVIIFFIVSDSKYIGSQCNRVYIKKNLKQALALPNRLITNGTKNLIEATFHLCDEPPKCAQVNYLSCLYATILPWSVSPSTNHHKDYLFKISFFLLNWDVLDSITDSA